MARTGRVPCSSAPVNCRCSPAAWRPSNAARVGRFYWSVARPESANDARAAVLRGARAVGADPLGRLRPALHAASARAAARSRRRHRRRPRQGRERRGNAARGRRGARVGADRSIPAVFVLEDVHWADEATLDVLTLLTRRVEAVPALVIATYRDDLDRAHPLRPVLGELARSHSVGRMKLVPLSPGGVAHLAAPDGVDPAELYRKTAGNPLFVVEAASCPRPHLLRSRCRRRAAAADRSLPRR
jgi:hypothetical protein